MKWKHVDTTEMEPDNVVILMMINLDYWTQISTYVEKVLGNKRAKIEIKLY